MEVFLYTPSHFHSAFLQHRLKSTCIQTSLTWDLSPWKPHDTCEQVALISSIDISSFPRLKKKADMKDGK